MPFVPSRLCPAGQQSWAHLRHDVGAGWAVPTAVAHFYLVELAGALAEVAKLSEEPARPRTLLCGEEQVSVAGGRGGERGRGWD